ncbi:septum formation family protein [Melissospora conviva]|uniref:septum formation family protein n=1 Tax=Melissospora conviva TaxID=3388432 RepID=UPI003B783E56
MARRGLKLMAAGALAALLTAGCAPPGVDGDLVDDWPVVAEPQSWSPVAGECHPAAYWGENSLAKYTPVSCDESHSWETFHVGTLPAERVTLPPAGGVDRAAVFKECSAEADKFLGGDWRDARLSLQVLYPTKEAWSGGARWFRCELANIDIEFPVNRRESLRDSLAGSAPALARGCYTREGDNFEPIACDKPHNYEYVGTWFAEPSMEYADLLRRASRIHRECRSLVAKFAKVPDDAAINARTGTQLLLPRRQEWDEGDRGVGCMLFLSRTLHRSMKDAGTKGLPINYR